VVADKQGRVLVPEEMGRLVGLSGEVVLVGAFETFEIWNPETWEATKRSSEASYDRVAELIGL
jgi:MraZ protein